MFQMTYTVTAPKLGYKYTFVILTIATTGWFTEKAWH